MIFETFYLLVFKVFTLRVRRRDIGCRVGMLVRRGCLGCRVGMLVRRVGLGCVGLDLEDMDAVKLVGLHVVKVVVVIQPFTM